MVVGIQQGDEIVGMRSGAFGVVKKILNITASNTYIIVVMVVLIEKLLLCKLQQTLQQTQQVNSMLNFNRAFLTKEGIRKVNSSVVVGNNVVQTLNENIRTTLNDSLLFVSNTVGNRKTI